MRVCIGVLALSALVVCVVGTIKVGSTHYPLIKEVSTIVATDYSSDGHEWDSVVCSVIINLNAFMTSECSVVHADRVRDGLPDHGDSATPIDFCSCELSIE